VVTLISAGAALSVVVRQGAIFSAALVGAIVGAVVVFPLALAVPEVVVVPLMMAVAGLYAGLAAAWTANLLAPDRTASRVVSIAGVSVVVGLLLAAGIIMPVLTGLLRWPFPAFPIALGLLVLALFASRASGHFRRPKNSLRRDAWKTLGLVGLSIAVEISTVFVTCSIVPCIP
jgi:hypothetical protein